jgi:hypothetical protein
MTIFPSEWRGAGLRLRAGRFARGGPRIGCAKSQSFREREVLGGARSSARERSIEQFSIGDDLKVIGMTIS